MILNFTDYEIDTNDLVERSYKGIIPLDWKQISFVIKNNGKKELSDTISRIDKWLRNLNMEKRWAITYYYAKKKNNERGVNVKINISFEYEHDITLFTLSDGINDSHKEISS